MTNHIALQTHTPTYTLAEAAERLCTSVQLVRAELAQGTLQAYAQETGDALLFDADAIDQIAIERERALLFNSTDPLVFSRANARDMLELFWLRKEVHGNKEVKGAHEERMKRFRYDPEMYYVIKQSGIMLGFIGQVALNKETTVEIMDIKDEPSEATYSKLVVKWLRPTNIIPISQNTMSNIYLSFLVKQGLPQSAEAGYKLMHAYIDLLKSYVAQGIIIENLYAVSETGDGIRCCQAFHFTETYVPGIPLHRFQLNLLTSSDLWAQSYQQVVFARYPELRT